MSTFWSDVRFGARTLVRSRGFTAVALLSLALGSGVTSSIFSVVRAVLLTPLPYPAPDELVLVEGRRVVGGEVREWPLSFLDFQDLRERQQVLEDIAVRTNTRSFNISVSGEPEHVSGEMVSASYFRLLGVEPVRGRTFTAEEDRVPSGAATAIIGYDLWRRHFGGEPDLSRRDLKLNGESYQVVGVLPAGFRGLTDEAEVWVPISRASFLLAPRYLEQRNFRWLSAVGRLKPGMSVERAQAELDVLAASLEKVYPEENKTLSYRIQPLVESFYGNLRPILLTLLAAAAFVLLIACTNVANLLVSRGLARQSELAVRVSLGASQTRLIRQLLTESSLLAVLGGALGLLLAAWTTRLLVAASSGRFRSFVDIQVDGLVAAVGIGATVVCVLVAGLLPAISTTRASLAAVLRQGVKTSAAAGRRRLQNLLVVAEVALAVVLLVGAGLLLRELDRLRNIDLGFSAQELLTLRLDLADRQYKEDENVRVLVRGLTERLGRVPGVASVAFASDIPTDEGFATHFHLEGKGADDQVQLRVHSVSPEYFATLGIPLQEGRACTTQDTGDTPPVAVVSRALARQWPGESPVGKRLKTGRLDSESPWMTVIGVVADVRQGGLSESPPPDLYPCLLQSPPRTPPILSLLVRPEGVPAASLAAPLQRATREVTPTLPLYDVATLEQRLDEQASRGRFLALLMALFSGLALVLAVIGVYGVISYSVGQRRREIAIRLALGANRSSILWLVVAGGAAMALLGIGLGLLLALGLGPVMAERLTDTFQSIEPIDPLIFAGAALLFLAVAVAASLVPAQRATNVEAAITLRQE